MIEENNTNLGNFQKKWQLALALLFVVFFMLMAFFWNEARKEIVFLCRNFTQGVVQTSVLQQLETVSFSRFEIEKTESGSIIVLDSMLNFGFYQCVIGLDSHRQVVHAQIQ